MPTQVYYHPYLYEAYYVDADEAVWHLAPLDSDKPVVIQDILPELDLVNRGFTLTHQVFESTDKLGQFLYDQYEATFLEDTK